MEGMTVLRWLSTQGWADLYLSAQVANPTSGPGAVLFDVTAPVELFLLRFILFNGATVKLEYVLQEYDTDLAEWAEVARTNAPAKQSARVDTHYVVEAGAQIRIAIVSNPEATGVSLAGVEYLRGA